jgi:hypothetical protein
VGSGSEDIPPQGQLERGCKGLRPPLFFLTLGCKKRRVLVEGFMPTVAEEYKTIAGIEHGGSASGRDGYAFRIQVRGIDHSLSDDERKAIYKAQDILDDAFLKQFTNLNPETHIKAKKEKADLLACFGPNVLYVDEIPNGYCNLGCCAFYPWFIVTTPIGRIKIGWRKRVIEIDWSDTKCNLTGTEITTDDVTRTSSYIHAYGYEKATEYLNKLFVAVPA